MDPLSIVGGVISIVTLTKDIIKIAREIKKSIDKVPKNRKNLQKLTADIAESVEELGSFYEARKDGPVSNPDLYSALLKLQKHMEAIHRRCCDLTTPKRKGRINKLRGAYKDWSECNHIEDEIGAIKNEVEGFRSRFLVLGIARIERHVTENPIQQRSTEHQEMYLAKHQERGLIRMKGFTEDLEVSSYYKTETTITTLFPEDLNRLYLHSQIKALDSILNKETPAGPNQRGDISDTYLNPFKPAPPHRWAMTRAPSVSHREVVVATYEIIGVLQDTPGELTMQNGAWDMVNLAIQLHGLEMHSDAAKIGSWTVDIYRALLEVNTHIYEPYLALALRNFSRYNASLGKYLEATKAIEECINRERVMLEKSCKHRVRLELANSLVELWSVLTWDGDFAKGLDAVQESLTHLQSIRTELKDWECWSSDTLEPEGTSSSDTTDVENDGIARNSPPPQTLDPILDWDDVATIWLDFNTARACHSLSYSLEDAGNIFEAREREFEALEIYRELYGQHPKVFGENLARCLAHLSCSPLSNGIPPLLSLERKQESNQLFRTLAASHPTKFTAPFIESLWDYATLLHDTGDLPAAEQCSTEALELIRQSNSDPRLLASALQDSSWSLRRIEYHETVVTIRQEVIEIYRTLAADPSSMPSPTTIADRYYDLASDHILAGHKDDAIKACKEAVRLYRIISLENNTSARSADLARSLSYLTYTFNVAQKYDEALSTGKEAMDLYQRLVASDRHLIEPYLNALRRLGFASCHADDTKAIIIHMEVLQALRSLAVNYSDRVKWRLVDALHDHDYILIKHQRTHEACRNTEDLVNHLREMPLEGAEVPLKYMTALIAHAGNNIELGRNAEALRLCRQAKSIGEKFTVNPDNNPEIWLSLADTLSTYSECLRDTGKYSEALPASKDALDIYRRYPSKDTSILACRLREYAINLRHAKRLPEAIAAAEEAVLLCRSSSPTTLFVRTRLPYVLETLSVILAESGDEERAFETILEATNLFQAIKNNSTISEPWSYAETLYANALVSAFPRYAARGNWQDAETALSEAIAIYKRRVMSAPAYHPPLARALELTVIQLCATGDHEKAQQAARDLSDATRCIVDSEVAALVRVALAELSGRSFESVLKRNHLQCVHCSPAGMNTTK